MVWGSWYNYFHVGKAVATDFILYPSAFHEFEPHGKATATNFILYSSACYAFRLHGKAIATDFVLYPSACYAFKPRGQVWSNCELSCQVTSSKTPHFPRVCGVVIIAGFSPQSFTPLQKNQSIKWTKTFLLMGIIPVRVLNGKYFMNRPF